MLRLPLLLAIALLGLVVPTTSAQVVTEDGLEWIKVNFSYTYDGKNKSNWIRYASDVDANTAIRGVLKKNWAANNGNGEIHELTHEQHLAQFKFFDETVPNANSWTLGPSMEMLEAAAAATGHAELVHAGAIVQGNSNGGRASTRWAKANSDRAIAIILDHSWVSNVGPNNDPVANATNAPGIPMFFHGAYSDTFQNSDRRWHHHQWCTNAFRKDAYNQPCTATWHIMGDGDNHSKVQSRALHKVWLEEVIALRVPANIPTNGEPYDLIDIDIEGEGVVIADIPKIDGFHQHDNVQIMSWDELALTGDPGELANWWMPGPKTAAKYLEWVQFNGRSGTNTYTNGNQRPQANAGTDVNLLPGSTGTLNGTGSADPDNGPNPLTYAWSQVSGPPVTISNGNQASATFSPTTDQGTYVFELSVSDGDKTDIDQVTVTISTTVQTNRIARTATWRYSNDNTDHGTAWRAPDFDDSGWASGAAELGYGPEANGGEGDEATIVPYGGNVNSKPITAYFRHSFTIDDLDDVDSANLSFKRDDGAVIYLNGSEIVRSNMPAGNINHSTLAASATSNALETTWHDHTINKSDLVAGTNVIAVEVHQIFAHSSDMSFALELNSSKEVGGGNPFRRVEIETDYTQANTTLSIFMVSPSETQVGSQATFLTLPNQTVEFGFLISNNG